jgi:hypothetical protein
MQATNQRRKRRRRSTLTPRFGSSTIALEIGLIRQSMGAVKELELSEAQSFNKNKE